MRIFAGLGLLIFLAVLVYWMSVYAGGEDVGIPIAIACGHPSEGEIEMHVVVGVVMANQDRMKKDDEKIKPWPEWIKDHFILTDSLGNRLELNRQNHSSLIKPHEIVGTQEFFMVAKLKTGQSYSFDYIPDIDESQRYRHQFTAPVTAEKARQYTFNPVE
ncbi:MAG: hypothetical protein JSV03_15085 [Planctomycetota bacterium]|nr:MAG: hypothetical protein JSV03_15085 [Planctomycetota bacterium]